MTNWTLLHKPTRLKGRVGSWNKRSGIGVGRCRPHPELASVTIAVHHMRRICTCSLNMLPSLVTLALILSWVAWGTPGQIATLSGSGIGVLCGIALIPLQAALSQLVEDGLDSPKRFARLHIQFRAKP